MPLLEVARACKRFGAVAVVDDVSLTIERGALFALLGPSGCGKTTLLRIIAGLETPDSGRIVIDGVDVTALPPYARPVNMMFSLMRCSRIWTSPPTLRLACARSGWTAGGAPRASMRCWR